MIFGGSPNNNGPIRAQSLGRAQNVAALTFAAGFETTACAEARGPDSRQQRHRLTPVVGGGTVHLNLLVVDVLRWVEGAQVKSLIHVISIQIFI